MSMTKAEFFDILREYASKEFEDIPQSDAKIAHEFSQEFEDKMDKVIKIARRRSKPRAKIYLKIAAAAAAALLVLLFRLMRVDTIREPVVEVVLEKYEQFIDLIYRSRTRGEIGHLYTVSDLPKGFEKSSRSVDGGTVRTEYDSRLTDDRIVLEQNPSGGNTPNLDPQMAESGTLLIKGETVRVYKHASENITAAALTKEDYTLTLTYYGHIDDEDLTALIRSLA